MRHINIPKEYICTITGQIMVDPVTTADGQTYEREAIEKWLIDHNTSPSTGAILSNKNLTPNISLRKLTSDLIESNPKLLETDDVFLPQSRVDDLIRAIEGKHQNLIKVNELIKQDPRLLTRVLKDGKTAIHLAWERAKEALEVNAGTFSDAKDGESKEADTGIGDIGPVNRVSILIFRAIRNALGKKIQTIVKLPNPAGWDQKEMDHNLLRACEIGDTETIELLIELGANVNLNPKPSKWNIHVYTPLGNAARGAQPKAVELLLKHKADANLCDASGATALHNAVLTYDKDPKFRKDPKKATEVINLLVMHGGNLEIRNNKGETPLMEGAGFGCSVGVRALLENKADVHSTPKGIHAIYLVDRWYTPLHSAAHRHHTDTIDILLEYGAEIDSKDRDGDTPLHVAARSCGNPYHREQDAVQHFISRGASAMIQNKQGTTIIDILARRLREEEKTIGEENHDPKMLKAVREAHEFAVKHVQEINKAPKRILELETQLKQQAGQIATLQKQVQQFVDALQELQKKSASEVNGEKTFAPGFQFASS